MRLGFLCIVMFHIARENHECCKCEVHILGKLDEARLLGELCNFVKCGINGTNVKNDSN